MIKAIVTDIEGTTSSLSFVKEVLFPYARKNMESFVRTHAKEDHIVKLIQDVQAEVEKELSLDETICQLLQWIDEDMKITPLKALQGLLWEAGYKSGDFKGHIYPDAKNCLECWYKQEIKLYVYSSGSVYAQKLLFAYTDYGDLNYLFSGYFDTKIGAKTESASYQNIISEVGVDASELLFLSDIQQELDAAKSVGMKTFFLVREGNLNPDSSHIQVSDFNSIKLNSI